MDIKIKQDKSPDALRLIEERQKIKPGNLRINSDSIFNRKCGYPGDETEDEKMKWWQLI